MNDEKLRKMLNPFTEDVQSGRIKPYSCILNHVELILKVRSMGVSVTDIIEISGINYDRRTFSNKLSAFKRKLANETVKKPIAEKDLDLRRSSIDSCDNSSPANKITSSNDCSDLKYSVSDWSNATKFGYNGINTYKKAEAVNLCPSDFYGLTNYDRINIIQIINGWTKIINNVLIEDEDKPTKEQFLAKYKE